MTGHAEVTVVNQEKQPAFTKRELIRVVGGVIGLALAGVILWATGWDYVRWTCLLYTSDAADDL